MDTAHQGDQAGEKGAYHINAVDEGCPMGDHVATAARISEYCLVPTLEDMLSGFPFIIRGFHSDNGSEFINKVVAELLNKLLIRFTRSRPRHSNDNGLVESKNGSVVRKQLGYAHIPQECATMVNQFHKDYVNTYVNFHRPCFFAVSMMDVRGKVKKIYPYKEGDDPI